MEATRDADGGAPSPMKQIKGREPSSRSNRSVNTRDTTSHPINVSRRCSSEPPANSVRARQNSFDEVDHCAHLIAIAEDSDSIRPSASSIELVASPEIFSVQTPSKVSENREPSSPPRLNSIWLPRRLSARGGARPRVESTCSAPSTGFPNESPSQKRQASTPHALRSSRKDSTLSEGGSRGSLTTPAGSQSNHLFPSKLRKHVIIEIRAGVHRIREVQVAEMVRLIHQQCPNVNVRVSRKSFDGTRKSSPSKSYTTSLLTTTSPFSTENAFAFTEEIPIPVDEAEHDIVQKKLPRDTAPRKMPELVHQRGTHGSVGRGYLTYRDCRQVFTDTYQVPSVEVRRHCILVCLPPVTSFILHDRVYILKTEELK
eukprot:GHVT01090830.1.p1 GENE.GHVT01090830.1~~GHVT01090830.1.p1  ORF type:complete len:371 (+),score=17.93 GHVT01090830.1:4481-5593(+)